jgi:uncharacterized membrane protein
MADHLQHELRKEFQLERMILFSDAVFAIAITLLVLEIKVPPINRHIATDALLVNSLEELIPKFVGFFISFFIIGQYWTTHHRMFGYVINYNRKLLWLNLVFLLAIVLMPFSTAFYSEYIIRLLKVPAIVYVVNIVFLGVMNLVLWRYVTNPKNKLSEGVTSEEKKYFTFRAASVPVVFILMALIYLFVAPKTAVYLPLFIPVLMRLVKRIFFKTPEKTKSRSPQASTISKD